MDEIPLARVALLVGSLLFASCGDGGGNDALSGTCGKETGIDRVLCLDVRATTSAALQMTRDVTCGSAQWSNGACPRDDRLGGCLSVIVQASDGAKIQEIYWYYPSAKHQSEADVMNECLAGIETFVPADGGFPPL